MIHDQPHSWAVKAKLGHRETPFHTSRLARVNRSDKSKCWWWCRKPGAFARCWREWKLGRALGETPGITNRRGDVRACGPVSRVMPWSSCPSALGGHMGRPRRWGLSRRSWTLEQINAFLCVWCHPTEERSPLQRCWQHRWTSQSDISVKKGKLQKIRTVWFPWYKVQKHAKWHKTLFRDGRKSEKVF